MTPAQHDTEIAEACPTCGQFRAVHDTPGERFPVDADGVPLGSVSELLAVVHETGDASARWYPRTADGALGPRFDSRVGAERWLRMRGGR